MCSDDTVKGADMRTNRDTTTRHVSLWVTVLAVVAFLAAACGGSNGPAVASGGSSSPSNSAQQGVLAFSQCMRSHGVPNFPDPVDGDSLPKISVEGLGVSSSQFNAAESACQHLLPTGEISGNSASVERCMMGGICLPAVTHWLQNVELMYAACMRSHGLPSWPDPTTDAQGRVDFDVSVSWAASPPEPQSGICARQSGSPIH
jgi:hypothetical protein